MAIFNLQQVTFIKLSILPINTDLIANKKNISNSLNFVWKAYQL